MAEVARACRHPRLHIVVRATSSLREKSGPTPMAYITCCVAAVAVVIAVLAVQDYRSTRRSLKSLEASRHG